MKPDLSRVPKWGQKVWVHQGSGSKLDGCATEARWVGFNADSTHAHRIYWPDKNHVSVKCDVKFVSGTVSVPIHPLLTPNSTPIMSMLPPTQPTITQIPTQLPTPPVSKITTSTSKEKQCTPPLPPPATKSREEEMPDEEEEDTAPVKQTTTQQPSVPTIQKSLCIAQQTQSISTPKNKNKNKTKSLNEDSPKFINNGVFRGYHPDYRGSPSAMLLADNEQASSSMLLSMHSTHQLCRKSAMTQRHLKKFNHACTGLFGRRPWIRRWIPYSRLAPGAPSTTAWQEHCRLEVGLSHQMQS